jgi:hypothetical protein
MVVRAGLLLLAAVFLIDHRRGASVARHFAAHLLAAALIAANVVYGVSRFTITMLANDEDTLPTPRATLRVAAARENDSRWLARLGVWLERVRAPDDETVKRELAQWLPEYRPAVSANADRALS